MLFGGNVTVWRADYNDLSNLAKKQTAAESNESKLTTENAELKNNAHLGENKTLREKVRAQGLCKILF